MPADSKRVSSPAISQISLGLTPLADGALGARWYRRTNDLEVGIKATVGFRMEVHPPVGAVRVNRPLGLAVRVNCLLAPPLEVDRQAGAVRVNCPLGLARGW